MLYTFRCGPLNEAHDSTVIRIPIFYTDTGLKYGVVHKHVSGGAKLDWISTNQLPIGSPVWFMGGKVGWVEAL
jgi:hypothetical protein